MGEAYNLRDATDETWGRYTAALAEGLGAGLPWIRLSGRVALGLAAASEAVYRTLGIKSRPLLTRHAVYVFIRDQGYSIEKAQRDFGFRSGVSFSEGVKRSLEWFMSESGFAQD